MPTGVAIRDVRTQLFDAAERVLLRDGAAALTSRAVTEEAGCAKGVLHRHFTDFDAFLCELILDRVGGIDARGATLVAAAGTGSLVDRLTDALTGLFSPVALALVSLITFRDGLRARLRAAGRPGVTVLAQGTAMVIAYLGAERDAGRLAPGTDLDTLALSLVGTGHLLFAGRDEGPPARAEVRRVVESVVAPALPR
ncbi:TetR/AcrR family transcriptional regulator [Streptomyces sp. VRA16 Mangrove soil]|uniref:TetR/AcrR family transcriptional regulator n=1 Tax=Streptomyces sp. VRA16 Mangrove soil TaxID=2817434 RepID=UPI001A9DDFA8|nr:TetR/AcrR family transcriptional regulator [Streptomyces sp. VRA16 Mangrove soil]MBO1334541.1 TetR/AcrR family transcriptional regulator [Streptomyces sp. VRA16 Mangrove soil]